MTINNFQKLSVCFVLVVGALLFSKSSVANEDIMATVNFQIDNAGPQQEKLNASAVTVPRQLENLFISELVRRHLKRKNQHLIIVKPEGSHIFTHEGLVQDSGAVTLFSVPRSTAYMPSEKQIHTERFPAAEMAGNKKAGVYLTLASAASYGLTFYFTHDLAPAIAGTIVASTFYYIMGVKPEFLWAYLNGGGDLAVKFLPKSANKLRGFTYEIGKIAAGLVLNIVFSTAYTLGLNHPNLNVQFPHYSDFFSYVIASGATSMASKNTWDLILSKWRLNSEAPLSDKTSLLINYSKILFLAAVSPLMYIQSTRTEAMITLGLFGALALPGFVFEKQYRRFFESIISSVENSKFFIPLVRNTQVIKGYGPIKAHSKGSMECGSLF